jgi:hypothetical protein
MFANPPIMLPGKIIDLVKAAGSIIIGITRWQNGILHSSMSAREKDMDFLTSTILCISVKERDRAKIIKRIALYLSVFPVKCIKKYRTFTIKKAVSMARAEAGSAKFGLPPVMNMNVTRNIGRVYRRDIPNDFLIPVIFKVLSINNSSY